jgi:hypothetical protein
MEELISSNENDVVRSELLKLSSFYQKTDLSVIKKMDEKLNAQLIASEVSYEKPNQMKKKMESFLANQSKWLSGKNVLIFPDTSAYTSFIEFVERDIELTSDSAAHDFFDLELDKQLKELRGKFKSLLLDTSVSAQINFFDQKFELTEEDKQWISKLFESESALAKMGWITGLIFDKFYKPLEWILVQYFENERIKFRSLLENKNPKDHLIQIKAFFNFYPWHTRSKRSEIIFQEHKKILLDILMSVSHVIETGLDGSLSDDKMIEFVVNSPRSFINLLEQALCFSKIDDLFENKITVKIDSVMGDLLSYLNRKFHPIYKKRELLYSIGDFELLKKYQIFIEKIISLSEERDVFLEGFILLKTKISFLFSSYLASLSDVFHIDRLKDLELLLICRGYFSAISAHEEMLEKKSKIPEQLMSARKIDEKIRNIEEMIEENESELEAAIQEGEAVSCRLNQASDVLHEYERLLPLRNFFFRLVISMYWILSFIRVCQDRWTVAQQLLRAHNYLSRESIAVCIEDLENESQRCFQRCKEIRDRLEELRNQLSHQKEIKEILMRKITKKREANKIRCRLKIDKMFLFDQGVECDAMIRRCSLLTKDDFFNGALKFSSFLDSLELFDLKRFIDELYFSPVFSHMFDGIRSDSETFINSFIYKLDLLMDKFFSMTSEKNIYIEFNRPIIEAFYFFSNQFRSRGRLILSVSQKIKNLGFEIYESAQSNAVCFDLIKSGSFVDLLKRLIFIDHLIGEDFFFCLWRDALDHFNSCVDLCFQEVKNSLFLKDYNSLIGSLTKLSALWNSNFYRKKISNVFELLDRHINEFIHSMESELDVMRSSDISSFSIKLFSLQNTRAKGLLEITEKFELKRAEDCIIDIVSEHVACINDLISKKISTALRFLESFLIYYFY